MLEGKVMNFMGMTPQRELQVREMMEQYLAQWEFRDDQVAETVIVGDPDHWHFHNQYMEWYRTFSHRWIGWCGVVHEGVVNIMHHFICRDIATS
ncbi:hypothetical protein LINGRAHAP2_LOCUS30054 [Linum grandiflorum]